MEKNLLRCRNLNEAFNFRTSPAGPGAVNLENQTPLANLSLVDSIPKIKFDSGTISTYYLLIGAWRE